MIKRLRPNSRAVSVPDGRSLQLAGSQITMPTCWWLPCWVWVLWGAYPCDKHDWLLQVALFPCPELHRGLINFFFAAEEVQAVHRAEWGLPIPQPEVLYLYKPTLQWHALRHGKYYKSALLLLVVQKTKSALLIQKTVQNQSWTPKTRSGLGCTTRTRTATTSGRVGSPCLFPTSGTKGSLPK